jgi:hypothetical protein
MNALITWGEGKGSFSIFYGLIHEVRYLRGALWEKNKDYDFHVNEGEVNIRLLVQVFRQQNILFRVALAEEATSVVSIREYDTT